VSSQTEPDVVWLPPRPAKRRWLVGGPIFCVLFGLQCLMHVSLANRERGDFLTVLAVRAVTDPLMYVWFLLMIHGMEKAGGQSLRFKCPHCGDIGHPSKALRQSAIATRFTCQECKNSFRKVSPPS